MSPAGFRSSTLVDSGDWLYGGRMLRQSSYTPAAPGDSLFSSVSVLLDFDGTDGSTTFTDRSSNNRIVTAVNNSQLSTTTPKWGTACGLFDGTRDYLSLPAGSLSPGTGDFTVETWVRWTNFTIGGIFHAYTALPVNSNVGLAVGYFPSPNLLEIYTGAGNVTTRSFAPSTGTYYFIQLKRSSGSVSLWVDGVQLGAAITDTTNYSNYLVFPALYYDADYCLNGRLDDFRITHALRPDAVPTEAFLTF